MKRRFAALPLLLLAAGCAAKTAPPDTALGAKTSAGLTATLATNPAPPQTGDNVLLLTLSDAATHAPVGDANVSATAQMLAPRLPGTPSTGRAQGNGLYQIPVRLGIATRYTVQVQVQRPAHPVAQFTWVLEARQ